MTSPLALAATTVVLLLAAAAPAAAVPETELRPARLERGPDVAIPHLEGKTVVDGDVRVQIDAGLVRFLGTSGDDYVVGASNRTGGGNYRVLRVSADGAISTVLTDVPIWELVLSADGTQIADARYFHRRGTTRIRVYDATTGERTARRAVKGSASVLDMDEGRMVVGAWGPNRTFWWNVTSDATRRIADQPGYAANIRADRLATVTKDPYRGGCSVVSTLQPRERLWKSCDERVDAFSPNGRRMATIHILSDGLGPSDAWLRKAGGSLLAHYSTGYFGQIWWETNTALLLDANGTKRAATVRCVVADCERASDLRDVPVLRVTPRVRPSWRS